MHFINISVFWLGVVLCDAFKFVDPEVEELIKSKPWKPLCDAVTHGNLEDVQEVIGDGVDINLRDVDGPTALHFAVLKNRTEFVEFLIEKGADVKAIDVEGNTPLHYCTSGRITELLVSSGADVDAQNFVGDTTLHKVALSGHGSVSLMLLRRGADCNIQNNIGNTAINSASLTGRDKMVDELYQYGADVNVVNKITGNTPMHSAAINGYGKIVDCLIRSGGIVNKVNRDGNTPLFFSVKYGHELVSDMLLQNDADRKVINSLGKSPMDVARDEGNHKILDLLLRNSSAAAKACELYSNRPLHRILGGVFAETAEFPWMVALGYKDQNNKTSHDCGGTIISEWFVLTAAHCVKDSRRPVWIRAGTVSLIDGNETMAEIYEIQNIIRHPFYSLLGQKNDVALIRVAKPFQFSEVVEPACLRYDTTDVDRNAELFVTGWGKVSKEYRNTSNELLKAKLYTMPLTECNSTILEYNKFANHKAFRNGIHKSQYCAYDPKHISDSCEGDSGGPLQYIKSESSLAQIVGVVSYGLGCGTEMPSIYTRVSYYLYWIETIVWPHLLNQIRNN